ncbi:MAG: GLPGLI family protein [Chitinophagaceae bacterium]
MKILLLFPVLLCCYLQSQTQTLFYNTVKIEFEKTMNVHAYYKELDEDWYNYIKERWPKRVTNYYEFVGDSVRSIYKPGKQTPIDPNTGYRGVADKNVVFNDYTAGTSIAQKPVFEETFLVQDSLAKIRWKVTPDTRTIAGFECRKAIGILNDSIAVFAFYTDELIIKGGPEGIHGLPGMILGVGVPRLHSTWFATKVEVIDVNMKIVTPPSKGKKVDRATMMKSLDKVLRQWGTYGSKMIVNFEI